MKKNLVNLSISLILFFGVHPVLAQPKLGIVATNNQVILSWPSTATNYLLESATNLSPSGWSSASPAPGLVNSQYLVTNTISGVQLYYRLHQATPPAGMALIPGGLFTIGDSLDGGNDALSTNVTVSAFYMDSNLVSYSQWQTVYSYATNLGYAFVNAGAGKATNHPVQFVDWYDCVKWCNARSQQAGLTPVYFTDAAYTQVFTNGDSGTTPYANWQANGYRLPTEAEWEKAARGGLSGQRFPWGNTISESQANYDANPNPPNSGGFTYDLGPYTGNNTIFDNGGTPFTNPVGYFAPNGNGLNDMAGNLSEWCWDWYAGPAYPTGSPYLGGTDPRGPAGPSNFRVHRGGSWFNDASNARCADRGKNDPTVARNKIGFRCARGL